MKTPLRWVVIIGAFVGAIALLLCICSNDRRRAMVVARPAVHVDSVALGIQPTLKWPLPCKRAEPIIGMAQFAARFGLKQIEALRVNDRVQDRMDEWREEKGAAARVFSVEGKTLRMFIPALRLSPEQLRDGVEAAIAVEIGPERARAICQSEQGWATLVHGAALDLLLMDQDCLFTRIRDEGRVDQQEFAAFSVAVDQRDVSNGTMPRFVHETQIVEGDYNGLAGSNHFSWNALAKAPVGYFRSEPILGVTSAPKPMVVVYEDWDTGDVTIYNLRGKGSVEHSNLNNGSPPTP